MYVTMVKALKLVHVIPSILDVLYVRYVKQKGTRVCMSRLKKKHPGIYCKQP